MVTYVVVAGTEIYIYSKLAAAREKLAHEVKEHWEECIKYSCPKKEFYDDNYRTLAACLKEGHARINKHEYKIIEVPAHHIIVEPYGGK